MHELKQKLSAKDVLIAELRKENEELTGYSDD